MVAGAADAIHRRARHSHSRAHAGHGGAEREWMSVIESLVAGIDL
jgi:hypothetical protein